MSYHVSSFFLSLAFLGIIVAGSVVSSLPLMFRHIALRLMFRNPGECRPFYEEEKRRGNVRKEQKRQWKQELKRRKGHSRVEDSEDEAGRNDGFVPTEGGKDKLGCDVGYYARRVGLDVEKFKVQTEDGFIITLWQY